MIRPVRRWMYSNVLMPVVEGTRHSGLGWRIQNYAAMGRWSTEEIRAFSLLRLNDLVQYAYDTVPFYRERLNSVGYMPGDRLDERNLREIPILTRQDMLHHSEEMWSRAYQKEELLPSATGGTTTTPVTFYRDLESLREKVALQWYLNEVAGYAPGDKIFYLWGAQVDYAANPSWRWRLYERHFLRCTWAQTSCLNDDTFADHVRRLNDLKPRVIYAYSLALVEFSEYLKRVQPKFHRPKFAICTAELLTPEHRQLIEEVMGCEVFMHYGSRELGMTGSECRLHRMHTVSPALFLEYLPAGDGISEVVATDLLNRGMPFLRYKINDCVVDAKEACGCGWNYPLMGEVIGRVSDILIMPDGSKIPGITMSSIMVRILKDWTGISELQFVQNEFGAITMRFVATPGFEPGLLGKLQAKLREYFHPGIRWSFEEVKEIPRERSGKVRFSICNLSPVQQVAAR